MEREKLDGKVEQNRLMAIHTGTIVQWTCPACGNQWGVRFNGWQPANTSEPPVCYNCASLETQKGGEVQDDNS